MRFLLPIISFLVCSIYIHFGIYALKRNKQGLLHRLFLGIALTCAYWTFCTAIFHLVEDRTIARNIYFLSLAGPFILPAIITHTILIFTNEDIINTKKWLLFFIYLPSCISLIGLFIPGMIINDLVESPSGWLLDLNKTSFFLWFYIGFNFIIHSMNVILLIRWRNLSQEKKIQARIILITFLISVLFIFVEEAICNFIQIQSFPSLSHLATLIWFVGVLFVIKKYKFMVISPEKAVHEILFNMMDILILTNNNGEITRVNHQLTNLLGFTEKDLYGKQVESLFSGDLMLSSIRTFTQSRKNIKTKRGEKIPVLLRISPIKNGNQEILGFLLIGHDARERKKLEKEIAERQKIEKRLIESRSQYISTINAMDEIIHVVDSHLKIILCNDTFISIAKGFGVHITFGKTCLEEVFPFLKEEVFEEYREVFDTGKQYTTEEQNEIEEKYFFTEVRKIPVFKNYKVSFVVTIIRDITEKKKFEQSQLRAEIADSVSLVAGGIAHDYNNLLTTILGNITLAKTYFFHRALHNEALKEAESAGLQAKELTQQLLTFSQNGTLVKESGDIGKLLRKSTSFFLSGSNIKCKVAIPGDLYKTRFNKQQIARIFQNLLLNAKQAMPNGGVLQIRAQNKDIIDRSEMYLPPGKYIEISFIDQGDGIREEILPRIFSPYFTTKESGSGLGLATAYSIAKNHGGIIEVSSKSGEGSTFNVYLPADDSIGEEKTEGISRKLKKGKGTILIMDDDKHVRETLKRLLEFLGYSVVDAENGNTAVALYIEAMNSGRRYDLVILDFTIQGGENGGEVFQNLLQYDPFVKALIYSGYGKTENYAKYIQMGLKGVVKKPFEIEDLSEILNRIIRD